MTNLRVWSTWPASVFVTTTNTADVIKTSISAQPISMSSVLVLYPGRSHDPSPPTNTLSITVNPVDAMQNVAAEQIAIC